MNKMIFPLMVITFSCSKDVKAIGDKEDSIYCDKCNL